MNKVTMTTTFSNPKGLYSYGLPAAGLPQQSYHMALGGPATAGNPNGYYFVPDQDSGDDPLILNVFEDCILVLNIDENVGAFDTSSVGPLVFDGNDLTNPLGRYFKVGYDTGQISFVAKLYGSPGHLDSFNIRLLGGIVFDPQIRNPGTPPGMASGGQSRK